MEKNRIKLNESQLRKMIAESVKKIINETFEPTDLQAGDTYNPMGYLKNKDNDGPSQAEEAFEDEMYDIIENYKDFFLEHGYSAKEFYNWCCEIIRNAMGPGSISE